jgi:hypothetical protein
MATGRRDLTAAGTQTAALGAGGGTAATEEWTDPTLAVQKITTS